MADSQVSIKVTAKDEASAVLQKTSAAIRNVNDNYESLSAYMKRTASEAQNAANAQKAVANATDEAGDAANNATGKFDGLFKTFTLASLASSAIQKGIQLASSAIREGVQDATAMERSILGLNSAANAFGVSSDQMNGAIKTLTADGLVSFTTASTTLQNLLSTGMDIDTATSLIQRFKDEAAFGGSETISFTDKVKNLSEAYMSGSSQMGNLNGHVANFSDALELGAAILGKNTAAMTESEKEQAKLIGYMEQGAFTAGNAAQMTDTHAGAMARQAVEAEKASVTLGNTLMPTVEYVTGSFTSFLQSVNDSSDGTRELQAYLVVLAATVRTVAQVVIGAAQVMYGAIKSVMTLSFDPINQGINRAAEGFVDTWDSAYTQLEKIYTDSNGTQLDSLNKMLDDAGKSYDKNAAKRSTQEADLTRQFQRQMEQRSKSFTESIRDMVIAHRDKALAIKADLADEDAAYAKSAKKREQSYLDDIASLEERHAEKVADLTEQISDEKQKGLLVDGVFFQQANTQKIAKLEKSLQEEQSKFATSMDKRKSQYAEDVLEAKAAHDEKLANLQTQLDAELVILNAHRADVAAVGEAQKEDDISRLKRQFAEGNAEAARNYQEQLARIRNEGAAQGSAYGAEYQKKMEELRARTLDMQRQTGAEQEKAAGDAGAAAGRSWASRFAENMDNFSKNSAWGKMVQEWSKGQDQFVQSVAKFFGIDPQAASRVFTGRATGGVTQPGEITLVGERGPEIAQFPAGTRIIPADQTKSLLNQPAGGATINYSIGTQVINSPTDMRAELQWLAMKTR